MEVLQLVQAYILHYILIFKVCESNFTNVPNCEFRSYRVAGPSIGAALMCIFILFGGLARWAAKLYANDKRIERQESTAEFVRLSVCG